MYTNFYRDVGMMSYKNISNFFVKFMNDLGDDLDIDEWQEKIAECSGDDKDSILKRRNYGVQIMHQVLCAAYLKTANIVTNNAAAGIFIGIPNIPKNDNTSESDAEEVKSSPIKKPFKVNSLSKNYVPETMRIDQKFLARKESNTSCVPETQAEIIDEIGKEELQNILHWLFLENFFWQNMNLLSIFSPIETSLSPPRSPENEIKIDEIKSPPSSPILGEKSPRFLKKKSEKQPKRQKSTSLISNNSDNKDSSRKSGKKIVNKFALDALLHSKLKPGDPGYYSPESLKRNSEMYPPLPIKIEKHSKVCMIF